MSRKNLLFVTLSEYGQSNTFLALIQEFQSRKNVNIDIASYPELQERVQDVVTQNLDNSPDAVRITFHALSGATYKEIYQRDVDCSTTGGKTHLGFAHPPTSKSLQAVDELNFMMHVWNEKEFVDMMNQIKDLINKLQPDLILVDYPFIPAREACRLSGKKFIVNSPIQLLDFARPMQPWLKWLWHYPAPFSGYRYPLSWSDMFSTIYINIMTIINIITSPSSQRVSKFRKDHGLESKPPWMVPEKFEYICPSIPETELPCKIPPSVKLCGPIILDSKRVEEADPELFAWLNQAPTIYISFGTHTVASKDFIRGILGGLLIGLPSNVQVLWKLKQESSESASDTVIEELLSEHAELNMLKTGRLKIVDWIVPDPLSIIQHPNVKCFVHHGGANSFFEACFAGVPQIIIAQWYDLYDNAVRAEYRGFGIYGNREAAPSVEAKEFGEAVHRITGDTKEAIRFRKRAEWVGELCRKAGGRKTAVDHLLGSVKSSRL